MKLTNKKLSIIFKALSDKNRLEILLCVKDGCNTCMKDINEKVDIGLPTISHHVKELVNADLIKTKKEGRWIRCEVNEDTFSQVSKFIEDLEGGGK